MSLMPHVRNLTMCCIPGPRREAAGQCGQSLVGCRVLTEGGSVVDAVEGAVAT